MKNKKLYVNIKFLSPIVLLVMFSCGSFDSSSLVSSDGIYAGNENNLETGRISVIRDSRQVLIKIMLFQLRGHGQPQYNSTPNFFPNSKTLYYRFQMRFHLFQNSFGMGVNI